ncbi:GNAT family N-acetyltransferase [Patiriisocius hiemis]|uniref:GNAT family N-acetyltransferase n=1 Tax=Patiriisocius hiemis TaxID=3075604 RepID=A0ABU2YEC8_9FLAO|nr:GNAT family N-acetyltransferase [Constantimarinum sp. W242]MDT0556537.1 GNAT family N-acetyltransferase [Constantimarinum sp. W242]
MNDSPISFRIIPPSEIETILPLLSKLNEYKIPEAILLERIHEMKTQNYECLGMYNGEMLMGICGMWFQTRHYAGRSLEIDHVIIDEKYRNQGIGKQMMQFIYKYAKSKSCNWVELNTYVHNFPSHKFYYNEGFVAKGYHFVKTIN